MRSGISNPSRENKNKFNKKDFYKYKIPQKGLFCPISDKDKFITNASPNKYGSDYYNNTKENNDEREEFSNNNKENKYLSAKYNRSNLLNNRKKAQSGTEKNKKTKIFFPLNY